MAPLKWLAAWLLLAAAAASSAAPLDPWSGYIAEASSRFGIPETWIRRVIAAESGGQATLRGLPVTSRTGAMGPMQLMPGTWAAIRRRHGLGTDPYDPRDNILAGTAYLRAMYERFGYPGLFGAYNAGPARFFGYLAGRSRLPAETVDYMAKLDGLAPPGPRPGRSPPAPGSMALLALDRRAATDGADRRWIAGSGSLFAVRH